MNVLGGVLRQPMTLGGVLNPNRVIAFDASYAAVIDRANALGYTLPSFSQRIKQNKLVLDLKAGGIWTRLDVFYVFANNGGSQFGTLNWKAPSANQCTLVNAPTFTANQGFTGNGVDSYIDSNYNPTSHAVNYAQDNAGLVVRIYAGSGTGALSGLASGANINRMVATATTTMRLNSTNSAAAAVGFNTTAEAKALYRTNSVDIHCLNGGTQTDTTQTSTGMPNENLLFLRSGTSYGAHTIAIGGFGASLLSQHAALRTAMTTYLNSL